MGFLHRADISDYVTVAVIATDDDMDTGCDRAFAFEFVPSADIVASVTDHAAMFRPDGETDRIAVILCPAGPSFTSLACWRKFHFRNREHLVNQFTPLRGFERLLLTRA